MQASPLNLGNDPNRTKSLQILIAAALGMAALLAILPAAGHDQLWFLLMGERWLRGATLYGPALFDSNPPLIVWLSAIPVWLGEHLYIPAPAIGKVLILFAEAASAALSLAFLRRLSPGLSRLQLTGLAFAYVTIFAIVPARDLGQRDHLTAIFCLPYILAAALGTSPDPSNPSSRRDLLLHTSAGLFAAVGICLKPHQALIPIAVELTRLYLRIRAPQSQTRPPATSTAQPSEPVLSAEAQASHHGLSTETRESAANRGGSGESPAFRSGHLPRQSPLRSLLRPEPPILILSGLLFLAAIHRLAPAYFTLALPTLRDTYWAIGHLAPLQLLAESLQLHILAAITLTLFALRRTSTAKNPLRPAILILIVAALTATLAYYLQGTGWYYQQLPAISLFASALALQLLHLPDRLPDTPWLPRVSAALALLALALTTHFTGYPFTRDRSFPITSPDPTFFTHLPPNTPVALITTSVDDSMMPVARYHLLWAQRTNNVWTLPAILRSEAPQGTPPKHTIPPDRLASLDRQQHRWMVEDLNRWRPQLILVARCQSPEIHCQELEDRHDNLLAWFLQDPAFAQIWGHYRYLRTSGNYDAYVRN